MKAVGFGITLTFASPSGAGRKFEIGFGTSEMRLIYLWLRQFAFQNSVQKANFSKFDLDDKARH